MALLGSAIHKQADCSINQQNDILDVQKNASLIFIII